MFILPGAKGISVLPDIVYFYEHENLHPAFLHTDGPGHFLCPGSSYGTGAFCQTQQIPAGTD
jgi:hypothetical protein